MALLAWIRSWHTRTFDCAAEDQMTVVAGVIALLLLVYLVVALLKPERF